MILVGVSPHKAYCLVLCILSSVGPLLCCTYVVHLIYLFCTSCSTCHPSYDHRVKKTSFCYHMRGSMTLAEYSHILMFIFIAGCLCVGFELAGAICGSESCYVWTETVRCTWIKVFETHCMNEHSGVVSILCMLYM